MSDGPEEAGLKSTAPAEATTAPMGKPGAAETVASPAEEATTPDGKAAARRIVQYTRAAARYGRLRARVERNIAVLAGVRLGAFLVGAAGAFIAWQDRAPAWWAVAGLGLVAFTVAVVLHRRPFARAPRLEMLTRLCEEGAARLRGDWAALPDDGAAHLDPERPELGELQVFGRGSLYQLVNRAALPGGRARLAALLRDAVDAAALPDRQAAARELVPLAGLRRRVEAEGRLVARIDDAAMAQFLSWAEAPAETARLRPWVIAGAVLVPITLTQLVLTIAFKQPTFWQLTLGAQFAIYFATTRRLSAGYLPLLAERHRPFVALRRMFEAVERRRFVAPPLAAMRARFDAAGERPSKAMSRLEGVVESLAVRHGALLYGLVSTLLLWELWWCYRLEGWRAAHGRRVREDLAALADFEALASMAALAHDHPRFCWPEVRLGTEPAGEAPVVAARQLAYPLFRPEKRVANDFTLDRGGQLVLITGSNMSGKSSFLRALGANAILAQAGAPVCAAALSLQACRLSTSIQVTDAPEQGLSRFYAEVRRIRRILEQLDAAEADATLLPRLYLVDEMLSGTNSRERNQASRAIVGHLLSAGRSFGLVTTHDLELVRITDDRSRVPLYHFSDRFDGKALHFDYTLRAGHATTTNALHVLRIAGIAVPDGPGETPLVADANS